MKRWAIVGGLACVGMACGGNVVHLGTGGDGGSGNDGSVGAGNDAGTGADGSAGSNPLSGTYTGYIQSFMFPDGTDTVVMNLTFASDGTVTGTVFFGTGAPLAPPTDPSVGYPPGYGETGANVQGTTLLEGFEFSVLGGTYAAPRLQLGLDPDQLWTQWCELQTTYPFCNCPNDSDGGCPSPSPYRCLPNAATGGNESGSGCQYMPCGDSAWIPIDCGRMYLCSMGGLGGPNPCQCTATGCSVPVPAMPGITFDMQLASGALDGSESGIGGQQVLNVHLMK
jgi:hypothetical protein